MPSKPHPKPNPAFRRRPTAWPGSLHEIYAYLDRHPYVRITDYRGSCEAEYRSTEVRRGCRVLVFQPSVDHGCRSVLPVAGPVARWQCPQTGQWTTFEAGIVWDDASRPDLGITVEIGLDMVRIEYLK